MTYIDQDRLRELLGNISDVNVTDALLDEAEVFCNGVINAKIGGEIPDGSPYHDDAVGIAYLFGKVFAQFGNETEKVRKLDYDIAMGLLDSLYNSMVASGAINEILETDKATIDDVIGLDNYLTSPLNPNGITVLGAKGRGGVFTTTAQDVAVSTP
jgi:hypothetical protein